MYFCFIEAEFGKIAMTYGGERILSKEIILKIKEAEAEAERIRNDAVVEAAARVRRAEDEGKRLCERAEAEALKVNRAKLEIASERADAVIGDAKQTALAEANAARESAEFNIREAVRLIVAGVYEQCQ